VMVHQFLNSIERVFELVSLLLSLDSCLTESVCDRDPIILSASF